MPCLIVLIALALPRLAIVLLFLFSDYLSAAYEATLWPVLGFLFLPYTTLAYAVAINEGGGVEGWYLVLLVVAVLADVGAFGGGAKAGRARTK